MTTEPAILDIEPSPDTLVAAVFDRPDHVDGFLITSSGAATVEDFATRYFLGQPRWLALVSMNVATRAKLIAEVGEGSYREGTAVGAWKVFGRSGNEIMFGDHMGFMEYRFSFLHRPDGNFEASTVVRYCAPFANVYFSIVKPFHRLFVKLSLRKATHGSNRQLANDHGPRAWL